MPDLSVAEWVWAVAAAIGIGLSKSGFAGVGFFHILIFAWLFGPKSSTGMLLPLLVVGDVAAVAVYRRHARWDHVMKILPPSMIGVVVGWLLMERIVDAQYRPMIGTIVLGLTLLQILRLVKPQALERIPHSHAFALGLGLLAGTATMLANAAGPIVALYLLAVALPKFELVGTGAWFFLIINVFKLPFSWQQGLIDCDSLTLNAILAPVVPLGLLFGSWLIKHVPQRLFDLLLLIFAAVASLRLLIG
ncbi:MAG: sulfite exporter TauE/SafE family protein [Pirellulales bacterium]